jgi:hypothetical protein
MGLLCGSASIQRHVFSCSGAPSCNPANPSPWHPASCLHTWFSLIGCAAAHQSPIRIKAQRALRCVAPGCIGSPRKPSVPHRVQSTRPIQPAAQVCGFARVRSNPLWLTVRAQRTPMPGRDRHAACNQLWWFCQHMHNTAGAVPLIAFAPTRVCVDAASMQRDAVASSRDPCAERRKDIGEQQRNQLLPGRCGPVLRDFRHERVGGSVLSEEP